MGMLALYDQDQRKDVEYPNMRREVTPHVIRHIDMSAIGEGSVIYSQLNEATAEAAIREQITCFESIGQGFTIEEADAVMVLDLNHAPEILWQPVRHKVQRITDPEKLVDVRTVEQQVWEENASWVIDFLGETLKAYPCK